MRPGSYTEAMHSDVARRPGPRRWLAVAWAMCSASACAGDLDRADRFDLRDPIGSTSSGGAPSASGGASGDTAPLLPVGGAAAVSGGAPATAFDAGAVIPAAPIPTTPPIPVPACITDLFVSRCADVECHGPTSGLLDLVSPGVVERLLGQLAAPSLACAGRVYLATDGSASLILDKLADPPPCGSRMPLKGRIGAQNVECLQEWVSSFQVPEVDAGAE
jgi:hypothetical protein